MGLFKRSPNKPKTINVEGREFYRLGSAAQRLGIEKSTLRKKLHEGIYRFNFGKLGTSPNAPLVVDAGDVERYLRARPATVQFVQLSAQK